MDPDGSGWVIGRGTADNGTSNASHAGRTDRTMVIGNYRGTIDRRCLLFTARYVNRFDDRIRDPFSDGREGALTSYSVGQRRTKDSAVAAVAAIHCRLRTSESERQMAVA